MTTVVQCPHCGHVQATNAIYRHKCHACRRTKDIYKVKHIGGDYTGLEAAEVVAKYNEARAPTGDKEKDGGCLKTRFSY